MERDWLEERHRYDAEARNPLIEDFTLDIFDKFQSIRVLDIGSGLGANVRYYAPLFPCSQEWILAAEKEEFFGK